MISRRLLQALLLVEFFDLIEMHVDETILLFILAWFFSCTHSIFSESIQNLKLVYKILKEQLTRIQQLLSELHKFAWLATGGAHGCSSTRQKATLRGSFVAACKTASTERRAHLTICLSAITSAHVSIEVLRRQLARFAQIVQLQSEVGCSGRGCIRRRLLENLNAARQ